MQQRNLLWAILAAFVSLFLSAELFAQADVIEKRRKLMKSQSAAAKAIKGAVKEKDYATIETKAKDIMGTAGKIVGLFPAGSTQGKTKAKAEIWEKSDDFAKRAKNLGKAASELADVAMAKDEGALNAKVKALSGACGACHKAYRAKKYSE